MFRQQILPVRGIHRRTGWRYFKRMLHTQNPRRWAQPMPDEPGPRAKRKANNLPNPWDDWAACWQRTWKVLGKRRKAWDR